MRYPVSLLLHNIRSAHNVGSIFRTADAAGVREILLSGYTPRPLDRFGKVQSDIAKTALGAEKTLRWEYATSPRRFLTHKRKEGWQVVGLEQDTRAIDYRTFKLTGPTLVIIGNEVRGISLQLRAMCDSLLEIPMHGTKESLNVSVATGILLFQILSE